MKFAYSTLSFRPKTLKEAVDAVARGGFRRVELLADRPHLFPQDFGAARLSEFLQCLTEKNVKPVNLNACRVTALGDGAHPSWLEEDWKERELRIRYTLDCLRLAAALGIGTVSTNGGGPIPESMNQQEAWRLFVANMHRVTPIAKKLGVRLCIQPDPDQLIRTGNQVMELIDEVGEPSALGIDYDPVHALVVGEDPCETLQRLKDAVAIVRLSDMQDPEAHRHVQLGEGQFPLVSFLHCLEECGYQGHVIISLHGGDLPPEEVVAASRDYLRRNGYMPDQGP